MNNSAYSFPIFISSTIYNLVDLRAELNQYLSQLGYKVYVSDGEGFHDNSPNMQPWESCLNVLETSFIMILIIDGRYGKKFNWPNTEKYIQGRQVSPTHAEYIYANKSGKRTLVFVREEVLSIYQTYVTANNNAKKDAQVDGISQEDFKKSVSSKTKEYLEKILPKNIDFETLHFLNEIKNSEPIPWVKSFKDITDIKSEIQKKMLNELAELFLLKSKHLETVFRAFAKIIDELTPEKRQEKLKEFGIDKDYINQIEDANNVIDEQKELISTLTKELEEKDKEIKEIEPNNIEKLDQYKAKVMELEAELATAKRKISANELISENAFYKGLTGSTETTIRSLNNLYTSSSPSFLNSTLMQNVNATIAAYEKSQPVINMMTEQSAKLSALLNYRPVSSIPGVVYKTDESKGD